MRFTTYKTEPRTAIERDGLNFEPVGECSYQAKIHTSYGDISVMYFMPETTDPNHPYEVWYPGAKESVTFQTARDIMNYILSK